MIPSAKMMDVTAETLQSCEQLRPLHPVEGLLGIKGYDYFWVRMGGCGQGAVWMTPRSLLMLVKECRCLMYLVWSSDTIKVMTVSIRRERAFANIFYINRQSWCLTKKRKVWGIFVLMLDKLRPGWGWLASSPAGAIVCTSSVVMRPILGPKPHSFPNPLGFIPLRQLHCHKLFSLY
jgi:hypothetical protein